MQYDAVFLQQLDADRTKITYARITALAIDETPLESIEGRVTQGSVNLDGKSSVRRTCSLTFVAHNYDYNNYLWGVNTKFQLEIGVENNINPDYPKIIWFKQGIYFISTFNTSRTTNNFTISLTGKDKMSMLNGEVGGTLNASVNFDIIEEKDINGNIKIIKLPIKDIIRNVVCLYGGESEHNVIINDLDMNGLELVEYNYDIPCYLYTNPFEPDKDAETGEYRNFDKYGYVHTYQFSNRPAANEFTNLILNGDKECAIGVPVNDLVDEFDQPIENVYNFANKTTLKDVSAEHLAQLVSPFTGTKIPSIINIEDKYVYIAKISYGETAGYRFTDLIYPDDLIGNIGDNLTSILDKIKELLGEYEYFYNLDGAFVFQKQKTYINSAWSPIQSDTDFTSYVSIDSPLAYSFVDGTLITQYNSNVTLSNVRNDFSVWGERVGVSGTAIPIHMRYAIDQKPVLYTSIEVEDDNEDVQRYNLKYYTNISGQRSVEYSSDQYDWRELIYRMAQDYYKYAHILDDFEQRIIEKNIQYLTGKTGYENYYLDIISFWRDLYNPDITTSVWELKQQIRQCNEQIAEAQQMGNREEYVATLQLKLQQLQTELDHFENFYTEQSDVRRGWNKAVYETPQILNFWFDFLDSEGELSQYSVKRIGCRPKAVNNNQVKAIYFRETPTVIFVNGVNDMVNKSTAYTYINIPTDKMNIMFTISAQGVSAKSVIDDLIYKHSYCIETATINTIPIYYLEPNSRIEIVNNENNLSNYYTLEKITIPLTYNGTMSLTATKTMDITI